MHMSLQKNCKESVDAAVTLGVMLEQNICTVANKFNVHCKVLDGIQVTSMYIDLQDYIRDKNTALRYSWVLNNV